MDDSTPPAAPRDISAAWFVVPMSAAAAALIAMSAWPEDALPGAAAQQQPQEQVAPPAPEQAAGH